MVLSRLKPFIAGPSKFVRLRPLFAAPIALCVALPVLADNQRGFRVSDASIEDTVIVGRSAAAVPEMPTAGIFSGAENNLASSQSSNVKAKGVTFVNLDVGFEMAAGWFRGGSQMAEVKFADTPAMSLVGFTTTGAMLGFLDMDGSVSGSPGPRRLLGGNPVQAIPSCTHRPDWFAYVCPSEYEPVAVGFGRGGGEDWRLGSFSVLRSDGVIAEVDVHNRPEAGFGAPPDLTYSLDFDPAQVMRYVVPQGEERTVILSVPPPGTSVYLYRQADSHGKEMLPSESAMALTAASGADAVRSDPGQFWREESGHVTFRLGADGSEVWVCDQPKCGR